MVVTQTIPMYGGWGENFGISAYLRAAKRFLRNPLFICWQIDCSGRITALFVIIGYFSGFLLILTHFLTCHFEHLPSDHSLYQSPFSGFCVSMLLSHGRLDRLREYISIPAHSLYSYVSANGHENRISVKIDQNREIARSRLSQGQSS